MKKRVYVETTIPSYLAAWPSRDLLQAARQQITHDWWNNERENYELCISEIVLDEAAAGDADAAKRRLAYLADLPLLAVTDAVNVAAKSIMESGLLPKKATRDAIHIAIASVHDIDFLLTWNCRHIANAAIMKSCRTSWRTVAANFPRSARRKNSLESDRHGANARGQNHRRSHHRIPKD